MTATSDVRCLELSGRSAEAFEHLTFRGLAPLLRRAGADGRVLALGAVGDGGPIGLALAEISEDGAAAELRSLAVRSEHRRRGVATRLLAAVERALAVARVRSVAASFPDDRESGEHVARLLTRAEWDAPVPLRLLCRADARTLAGAPWTATSYSPACQVFPWSDIGTAERADVAAGRSPLAYPELLDPFRSDDAVDARVSIGLRVRGRVVGWCIAHHHRRAGTRWVDALFAAPGEGIRGGAVPLLGRFIRRAAELGIAELAWEVDRRNAAMVRFTERRLAPWSASIRSSSRSSKRL